MQITHEILDNGIIKVCLSGRMDVLGAQEIDLKFTALTASKKAFILVDMTEVSFLASLGMRTLIFSAKALSSRGGVMLLFKPQPNVLDVLETSGVSSLIQIHDDHDQAISILISEQNK
jgi:anti-anti-sigma factor